MSRFIWYDLLCSDLAGAKAFYSDIIGWKTEKFPGGDYELLKAGDKGVGGVMALPDEMKRAGVPHNGPMDVPGGDRIAQCMDPQGGVFAIYSAGKRA